MKKPAIDCEAVERRKKLYSGLFRVLINCHCPRTSRKSLFCTSSANETMDAEEEGIR